MGHRRFLVVTGFETLATGIFMSAQQHFMRDDPHARVVQDFHFRRQIGINTLFTLFIFISVLVEAVSDGGGGR